MQLSNVLSFSLSLTLSTPSLPLLALSAEIPNLISRRVCKVTMLKILSSTMSTLGLEKQMHYVGSKSSKSLSRRFLAEMQLKVAN